MDAAVRRRGSLPSPASAPLYMPAVPYEGIDRREQCDARDDRIQARQQIQNQDKRCLCSDQTKAGAGCPDATLVPLIIGALSDFGYR